MNTVKSAPGSRLQQPGEPIIRDLGVTGYHDAWRAMREFTAHRTAQTPDEVWLLQHPPVYTAGQRDARHRPGSPNGIPLIWTDRGGQTTYHGPGQLVAYVMVDLRRRGWGVRKLVQLLEQSVIDLLRDFHIEARRETGAPGVYVGSGKIAALGLRIRRGCSYHGIALNIDMDLSPFAHIAPCGRPDLPVTQLSDLGLKPDIKTVHSMLVSHLLGNLGYNSRALM